MLTRLLRAAARAVSVDISRATDDLRLILYKPGGKYFNIGSGSFFHPLWTNIDFVSDHYGPIQRNVVHHDLMSLQPLPIVSASADVIYTSHTIEHVKDRAVARLFEEAFRCLKPGGIFRVTTGPDADTDFGAMMRGDEDWFYWNAWYSTRGTYEHMYHSPANSVSLEERWLEHVASQLAPNNLSKSRKFTAPMIREVVESMHMEQALDYFTNLCEFDPNRPGNHVSWWNASKIKRFMRDAGFATVYRSGFGQSQSPIMRQSKLFDHTHPQISIYIEAVR